MAWKSDYIYIYCDCQQAHVHKATHSFTHFLPHFLSVLYISISFTALGPTTIRQGCALSQVCSHVPALRNPPVQARQLEVQPQRPRGFSASCRAGTCGGGASWWMWREGPGAQNVFLLLLQLLQRLGNRSIQKETYPYREVVYLFLMDSLSPAGSQGPPINQQTPPGRP